MNIRKERIKEEIMHLASRFLLEVSNRSSFLTVTKVEMSNDKKNAMIFFTVFPDSEERNALQFAKRKRSDFKKFIREKSKIIRIPHIDFSIDVGEKNRQKIDSIMNTEN